MKFNVAICVYLFGFWSPNLIKIRNLSFFFFFFSKIVYGPENGLSF